MQINFVPVKDLCHPSSRCLCRLFDLSITHLFFMLCLLLYSVLPFVWSYSVLGTVWPFLPQTKQWQERPRTLAAEFLPHEWSGERIKRGGFSTKDDRPSGPHRLASHNPQPHIPSPNLIYMWSILFEKPWKPDNPERPPSRLALCPPGEDSNGKMKVHRAPC